MLAIFAAAPELCQLIKDVEADYERFLQHPGRRPKGPYAEVLPFLAESRRRTGSPAPPPPQRAAHHPRYALL